MDKSEKKQFRKKCKEDNFYTHWKCNDCDDFDKCDKETA